MPRPTPPADDPWARLAATVTPLAGRARPAVRDISGPPVGGALVESRPAAPRLGRVPDQLETHRNKVRAGGAAQCQAPADTLDGGWDRRLRRGVVRPERSVDLHGHTLATANAALEAALADAVVDDVRVLLVVTGKPPRDAHGRRGLIRASIFDWLGHSRHGPAIAAVRNAHPRHGGAGALYLILRRRRGG